MLTAFLFAGQGSQCVGMFSDILARSHHGQELLRLAESALDIDLTRLMAEGPEEELVKTEIAQPTLLTLSVAQARHLLDLGAKPTALAGHSLGQFSALVVAESIRFDDAVRLVHERGKLMQKAVPSGLGAMIAVTGLEEAAVRAECEKLAQDGCIQLACHNGPKLLVVSGEVDRVEAAAELFRSEGARVTRLPVSVPFHCEMLRPMVATFESRLLSTTISDAAIPVIDNVTATAQRDADEIRASLVRHIVSPVLFYQSLEYLKSMGITRYVQCGPGAAALAFSKRVDRRAERLSFERACETDA